MNDERLFQEYNKCKLGIGSNTMEAEINFSDSEDLKDCVRFTIDNKRVTVPIKDLHALVWSVADKQQRDDLTPVKQTLVRKLVKRHVVEAKKDIKKGEMINVRCETNVPVEIWEGLKGIMPKSNPTTRATSFSIPIIGK